MKIYILLDECLNSEHHCGFVDVFDSVEAVLKYISEHQTDGHKFKYEVREFNDPTNPIDYPWTVPTYPHPIEPMYPRYAYPLGITWQWLPCMNGGPCTNPQHDCLNCPRPYGCGGTYSSNSGDDIKPDTSCTNVSVNSEPKQDDECDGLSGTKIPEYAETYDNGIIGCQRLENLPNIPEDVLKEKMITPREIMEAYREIERRRYEDNYENNKPW